MSVAAPTPEPPPETASNIVSVVVFDEHDRLAICVDADASDGGAPWTPADRRAALADLRRPRDGGAKAKLAGLSGVVIDDDCATSFADRLELAHCTLAEGKVVMRYYSFDLLDDDALMHSCLRAPGNWSALSRTSDEYKRAHARWQIERAQQQLQRLAPQ